MKLYRISLLPLVLFSLAFSLFASVSVQALSIGQTTPLTPPQEQETLETLQSEVETLTALLIQLEQVYQAYTTLTEANSTAQTQACADNQHDTTLSALCTTLEQIEEQVEQEEEVYFQWYPTLPVRV